MRFAMGLLILLALVCILGSLIPQGEEPGYYEMQYGPFFGKAVQLLQLDRYFHAPWFLALGFLLCLELLLCDLIRFPSLVRHFFAGFDGSGRPAQSIGSCPDPMRLFSALRMGPVRKTETGLYACRRRIGIWGAWLCHLGLLLVLVFFALGELTRSVYTVYGVPGQTKPIGHTGLSLTIDRFEAQVRPDDTVEQYTAGLTVLSPDGQSASGEASVNHPFSAFSMKFYQNTTGFAARLTVKKGEEVLESRILCTGEAANVAAMPGLAVTLAALYPDFTLENGMPGTRSGQMNNPAYLYRLDYKDSVLGMNVLTGSDVITIDQYTLDFTEPQLYTLIQVKKERFAPLTLLGAVLTLIGLILALYLPPEELWAEPGPEGWQLYARRAKGSALLTIRIHAALQKLEAQHEP